MPGWWILFKIKFRKFKVICFDSTTPALIRLHLRRSLIRATPSRQSRFARYRDETPDPGGVA
jgi:hypothetical protein